MSPVLRLISEENFAGTANAPAFKVLSLRAESILLAYSLHHCQLSQRVSTDEMVCTAYDHHGVVLDRFLPMTLGGWQYNLWATQLAATV
jgi:hypothetical protein